MSLPRLAAALCFAGVLAGCAGAPPSRAPLTANERMAIADTVRRLVHQYVAIGNAPTLCGDPSPMFKFFGYVDGAGLIASDTIVTTMTQAEIEKLVAKNVCSRRSMSGRADSVIVQVLTADVAMAAWTFDETKVDSAGVSERVKGSVLHSWLRTPAGWQATAWMDAHVVVPK